MSIETIGLTSSQLFANPRPANVKVAAPESVAVRTNTSAEEAAKLKAEMRQIVDELAKMARSFNRRLEFSINEDINQVIVKIVDQDSGEVVKQIPPEDVVKVHARIREAIGLLFDQKI